MSDNNRDTKRIPWRDSVAEEMVRQIEAGTAPWQKPWDAGVTGLVPHNPVTNRAYRGINNLWLDMQGFSDPRWLTYRQASAADAQVRKGEKATQIEYWKWAEKRPVLDASGQPVMGEDGKPQQHSVRLDRPKVFYARVFNASQIDGLEPFQAPEPAFEPEAEAERLLETGGVTIHHDQADRAFYNIGQDAIHLPDRAAFGSAYEYYATALHELGHATGHSNRLNRDFGPFGSETYAAEELRAEMASYQLARELGLGHYPERHAAYVGEWLKAIKEDRNVLFQAARDADTIARWVRDPDLRPTLELEAQQKRQGKEAAMAEKQGQEAGAAPAREAQTAEKDVIRYSRDFDADTGQFRITGAGKAGIIRSEYTFSNEAMAEAAYYGLTATAAEAGLSSEEKQAAARAVDAALSDKNVVRYEVHPAGQELPWFSLVGFDDEDGIRSEHTLKDIDTPTAAMAAKDRLTATLLTAELSPDQQRDVTAAMTAMQEQEAGVSGDKAQSAAVRHYIAVPYAEKDQAKAQGAKWDRRQKSWYVPDGADRTAFEKWQPATVRENALSEDGKGHDPVAEFADELKAAGVALRDAPVMDGKWHRAALEEDGKGERNASYRAFLDGRPNGQIKNFRSGELTRWVSQGETLSEEQRAAIRAEAAQRQAARIAERRAIQDKVAEQAQELWEKTGPVHEPTPYLADKKVEGFGLGRDEKDNTLVPMRDVTGRLWSMQTITPDGVKRFEKGGRKIGLMHVIDPERSKGPDQDVKRLSAEAKTVFIAESYGTAASVYNAVRQPVVVAFDSGNLKPVAEAIRKKHPDIAIVIAADNDHKLENRPVGNVGLNKGREAADAVGGTLIAPVFSEQQKARGLSDWNDLASDRGAAAVTGQIKDQLKPRKAQEKPRPRQKAAAMGA